MDLFLQAYLFLNAETSGKIKKIDKVVMRKVFEFISTDTFDKLGLKYIEINLSMIDCMDDKFADDVIKLMDEFKIDSSKINLEITESADSFEYEATIKNIEKLKDKNISFSIDDYGTGYSNIERFQKAPVQIVKIDKSLVDVSDNETIKMVLKNTFNLISLLNRETVVEGIETKEQVERFKEFGCDYIQGYFFSKPLPINDFINFIEKQQENG